MGLEIADDFRPILIQKILPPPPLLLRQPSMNLKLSDLNVETPELETEEECECHTPKSTQLKNNLICPPAPRKLRPAKRRVGPPPEFFHVPFDLASLFVAVSSNSKKIRAS
ncbi:hypothetical protein NE237_023182 [Protea cynaroides]|uniref:Uncharacterized protein n=1 Tax=Protea cynaroides TaxID=273540 RepID=A0A9Q0K6F0_9MAGN|nr:hypothetical protein NE237_023182 [Protea cynaroides]